MSKASAKAYRERNPEKVKAQIAAWRAKNPHKAKEYAKKRYAVHAEKMLSAAKARRITDPEASRWAARRWKYRNSGMDPSAAERARREHDGACDCCGVTVPGGAGWSVDHDHDTGRVRGVLCNNCNIGIGKLGDTLEGVLRAVKYLSTGPMKGQANG